MRKLESPISVAEMKDLAKILVKRKISPIRFMVGGAAMFAIENRNHHNVMVGRAVRSPLVRNILRVLVWAYVMFAKRNRADEHSPCLNIRIRAPYHPHKKVEARPAVIMPMWPIDE